MEFRSLLAGVMEAKELLIGQNVEAESITVRNLTIPALLKGLKLTKAPSSEERLWVLVAGIHSSHSRECVGHCAGIHSSQSR